MAELFSWVPLPYCSPLRCPFPIKSLALSAHVSPRTVHFWVLAQFRALEGVPLPATVWSPCSPRDFQESSPASQFESINSWCSAFQLSHLNMTTGKTISLTRWTFVGKVISLHFNMLSRFDIAFLLKSKHLLISWLQSLSTVILKPKKVKYVTASTYSPSVCHEVVELDVMILVFWMLCFSQFFFSTLLFYPSLSVIRVVSSAYMRLLIFLLAILIPVCDSSSLAFHMYPTYKLSKQNDNIQPWRTPFPILNQSVVPCAVLTIGFWPAYRFIRRQVRWSGIPISLRIFQFVVIHTVKGFSVVNETEVDVFFWNSLAFSMV